MVFHLLFILFFSLAAYLPQNQVLYKTTEASVYFKSDAPLELIEARSARMRGVINPAEQTFAFSVANNSFEGFNSGLQREHFNENYMESSRFPNSTFTGKIIEPIDFSKDGEFIIRAKGKLSIHGVEQERIIKSTVQLKNGVMKLHSNFTVVLQEHDITIPKIVYQKIAEEIKVEINTVLVKQ